MYRNNKSEVETIDAEFAKQLMALQPDLHEIEKKEEYNPFDHFQVGQTRTFDICKKDLDHTIDMYSSHECFQKSDVARTFQHVVPTDGIYMPVTEYHGHKQQDLFEPPSVYQNMYIFGDVHRKTTESILDQLFVSNEIVKIIFSFGCSRRCLFKFQFEEQDMLALGAGRLSVGSVFSLAGKFRERSGSTLTVHAKCDKMLAIFVGIVLEVCKYNFKSRECKYFDLCQYLEAVNPTSESLEYGHEAAGM